MIVGTPQKVHILPIDVARHTHPKVVGLMGNIRSKIPQAVADHIPYMNCADAKGFVRQHPEMRISHDFQILVRIARQNGIFLEDGKWREKKCPDILLPKVFGLLIRDIDESNYDDLIQ